jgi:hypothetical protein
MELFTATGAQHAKGGLWQMKIERPGAGGFKNYYIVLLGTPGYLFPSRERHWEF